MTNQHTPLGTAQIHWKTDADGHTVPVSIEFDDVYFSHAGGLTESHHVFIDGNDLTKRWSELDQRSRFVIAETGFGTGLNFLAACQLWQETAPTGARLHFISTEKFPLDRSDLAQALSSWRSDSTLEPWIDALIHQYPLPMAGCHRLHISDAVILDLWFGDAEDSLMELIKTQQRTRVDAWFLDGFAPAKNTDMWRESMFLAMAKLSHSQTTLATFTAAGFVRRGLIAAGFDVIKSAGFGRKREMLCTRQAPNQPNFPPPNSAITPQKIAIIGGGISGVSLAHTLNRRGHEALIIEPNALMIGASGNPSALFAPKLTLLSQAADHLPTVSFLYAHRHYQALNDAICAINSQPSVVFEEIGVTDFLLPSQKSATKRRALIDEYPAALIHHAPTCERDDPSICAALKQDLASAEIVAHVPMGGILYPAKIASALTTDPADGQVQHLRLTAVDITEQENGVKITTSDGASTQELLVDQVVICAGFSSHQLNGKLFNCRKIRGQVSWLALEDSPHGARHAIKYDGYCSQYFDGAQNKQMLLFGASFVRNSCDTTINPAEHMDNFKKLNEALPNYCQKLGITCDQDFGGRVGIRAQTPDYHPLVGRIPGCQRSFCLYGMGSKGFSFAPLCAEVLTELIEGGIMPITKSLLDKINPNRPRLQVALDHDK